MKLTIAILAALAATFIIPVCPAVNTGKPIVKKFKVTAYCPCAKCCGKSDRITASGHKLKYGDSIAAAGKKYPFGTKLFIPGYGPAIVKDRGGAITDDCIDVIFYEKSPRPDMNDLEYSHALAKKWGVRFMDVEIYE